MAGTKKVAGDKVRLRFGRRVRELRLETGISQERLAELSGLHRNYVGGVERGEINLSLENIHALAHGLRVEVVTFFVEGSNGVADRKRAPKRS